MLSRVAHLAYWMARYLERAENSARIVDVNAQLVLDAQGHSVGEAKAWEPIIFVLGDDELFRKLYGEASEVAVIEYVMFEPRNPNSVISSVNTARENARCIRDQLSSWAALTLFQLALKRAATKRVRSS